MKLKEGEKIVAEYFFITKRIIGLMRLLTPHNKRETGIKGILTNNRLIFISGSNEEHYPLSKITGIKSIKSIKSIKKYTPFFVYPGIIALALVPLLIIWYNTITLSPIVTTPKIWLAYYLIIIVLAILIKKKMSITSLTITQSSNTKHYDTITDERIAGFIDKVNETLK